MCNIDLKEMWKNACVRMRGRCSVSATWERERERNSPFPVRYSKFECIKAGKRLHEFMMDLEAKFMTKLNGFR